MLLQVYHLLDTVDRISLLQIIEQYEIFQKLHFSNYRLDLEIEMHTQ